MFKMIGFVRRVFFGGLVLVSFSLWAEQRNPEGFSTPEGHEIASSRVAEFEQFSDGISYTCVITKKSCTSADLGFDDKGILKLEGKTETVKYKTLNGERVLGLLLQRNYERVVQKMGGRLVAVMDGHSESRGWMKQVFLLERGPQRKWVHVDTFADSFQVWVTVVTVGDAPVILTASALQKEIDTQGFATLNVNFETNKALIRSTDQPTLDQVVELLKRTPALRLSVDGHTDNVGNADANRQLSQQRADAIVAYLVRSGIAGNRLQAKGFGMGQPVADNRSEEGRAKNRRVELVKLK